MDFPTDRPRAGAPATGPLDHEALSIPVSVLDGANAAAASYGVARAVPWLTAFNILAARYCRQADVTILMQSCSPDAPTSSDGQRAPTTAALLHTRVDPGDTFTALLDKLVAGTAASTHPTATDAEPPPRLLFMVTDDAGLTNEACRDTAARVDSPSSATVRQTPFSPQHQRVPDGVELALMMTTDRGAITAAFSYRADLFERETVRRLCANFITLLEALFAPASDAATEHASARASPKALPAQHACPVATLPILSPDERQLLVREWNQTACDYWTGLCLPQWIERQAGQSPDAIALIFGDESVTYAQLDARSHRLALRLRALGTGTDDIVPVLLPRGTDMVIAMLAVMKAGGAYLPLSVDDPDSLIAFKVEDSAARHAISTSSRRAMPALKSVQVLTVDPPATGDRSEPDIDAVLPTVRGHDLAYVIYTSGSTGRPKGVLIEHQGLMNNIQWQIRQFGFNAADRFLQRTTTIFDASIWELWTPLCIGAAQIIADDEQMRDPAATLALIRDQQATFASAVPSFFAAMCDELTRDASPLPLRLFTVGGETLSAHDVRRWAELTDIELVNMYGPTESTVDASFWRVRDLAPDAAVPIGRPLANTRIYIVDEHMEPVPIGVPGELYIAGDGLARGYLNRPALNAERFVADPFSRVEGARLYRTGDLGRYLPDGTIAFLGRLDRQVKVRGHRIELAEIETALRACAGVTQSAVVTDSAGSRLIAYVEPAGLCEARLRAQLAELLPSYMRPSVLISVAQLPRLANGKLDQNALRTPRTRVDSESHTRPNTATEATLVSIWADLLERAVVGIDESFFDLGGHSLLAVKLMHRIEQAFGERLRIAALFSAPTVSALALLIDEKKAGHAASCAIAINGQGSRLPLFFVSGWGGAVIGLHELGRKLPSGQPLVVLDTGQFGPSGRLAGSVEQVAAEMLNDMKGLQPEGPYYLCGFSLGGKFVYEIAQQLIRAGEPVGLLALLDCDAPGYPPKRPLMARLGLHLKNLHAQDARTNLAYVRSRLDFFWRRLTRRDRRLFGDDDGVAASAAALSIQESADAMAAICDRYTPTFFPGSLVLVTAQDHGTKPSLIDDDPRLGWGPLIGGDITVRSMAADHVRMVNPEHADALNAILADFLDAQ